MPRGWRVAFTGAWQRTPWYLILFKPPLRRWIECVPHDPEDHREYKAWEYWPGDSEVC